VRYIEFEKIAETVESLCITACYELPDDIFEALQTAARKESNLRAAHILTLLVENARIAKAESIPLCQDTGLAIVFVEQGCEVALNAPAGKTLADAVNAGVAAGYEKGYLRKSVVAEPLHNRTNTGSNTPAIIHHSVVPGDKLKDWIVSVVNSAGADACPPFIVGVGLGGNFEVSCLLSKKALLRNINEPNNDEFYRTLEEDLLARINALGLGPQGLGGDTTALACLIETAPCHIASLPVAVNIECHSHRQKSAVI